MLIFKNCILSVLTITVLLSAEAYAAEIRIVALGASHTYGKGVSRSEAYPAQLLRMLKARKVSASISNAGINGNTTGQMLDRLSYDVPNGTQIVILQPGGNDKRKGVSPSRRKANIKAIISRLKRRNIHVVKLPNSTFRRIRRRSPSYIQADGSHLTPKGYGLVASSVLPRVMSAIRSLHTKRR